MEEERRRSPQEKKTLAKEKDHISPSEYPHAFRRQWPQKKARAQRAHRHQINQMMKELTEPDEDISPQFPRRERVRKWGSITVGERIEGNLWKRTKRLAWNYFKAPYQSALHRERFAAFLKSIMEGRSEKSSEIALHFQELLSPKDLSGMPPQFLLVRARAWLTSFFQEEPSLERALRAWIEEVTQS